MSLVDLHIHTTFSDGHDTPSAVVKMAAENGVGIMAVTDHDNLGGLDEAREVAGKLGIAMVSGVEISTGFHGKRLHLLGLGISRESRTLNTLLSRVYAHRKEAMVSKLEFFNDKQRRKNGKEADVKDFLIKSGTYFSHAKTAEFLVENEIVADTETAINELFDTRVKGEFPTDPEEAISAVHEAGGVAILAHPFASSASLRKIDPDAQQQETLLRELIAFGLDGFECYQSEHGPDEVAFGLALAEKYGQMVSAGSDWHGAICDVGDMKNRKGYYPEHIGGLGVTSDKVAPLLERLAIAVDKG